LFKEDFACGKPYFLPAMQKVSKKISAVQKRAKISTHPLPFHSCLITKLLATY
jgi:hypothetical protein